MKTFAGIFAGGLVGGFIGLISMVLMNLFLPLSPEVAFFGIVILAILVGIIGDLKPERFSWISNIPFS